MTWFDALRSLQGPEPVLGPLFVSSLLGRQVCSSAEQWINLMELLVLMPTTTDVLRTSSPVNGA
jgi:hypothetical protein